MGDELETIASGQKFIAHSVYNNYFQIQIQLIANGNERNN
jgi:hypothetical protein